MACLREALHITIQFLDMAGAHSQRNLFHISFGACMRFKSNAFSLKYSLQKIYHTHSGYLKLGKGNINRFFSKCALWSTGEIEPFLWKAANWNNSGALKPRGTCPTWLEFLAASSVSHIYKGVCVYEYYFCFCEWCSNLNTVNDFRNIFDRMKYYYRFTYISIKKF
jgi:hypothetical protein